MNKERKFVVGSEFYPEGIAFKCTKSGTVEEFTSIEEAVDQAQILNNYNNVGRPREEQIKVWNTYLIVQI